MATLVHELAHATAALLLGGRLYSVRVHAVELRIHRSRRRWLWGDVSMHRVSRFKFSDGEVDALPPRGWARNIIYTASGYAIEWYGLHLGWLHVGWPNTDVNRAWKIALIFVFVWSVVCALESDDLYLMRRSWSRRHVRQRRG
jgi:hypothetical protein